MRPRWVDRPCLRQSGCAWQAPVCSGRGDGGGGVSLQVAALWGLWTAGNQEFNQLAEIHGLTPIFTHATPCGDWGKARSAYEATEPPNEE